MQVIQFKVNDNYIQLILSMLQSLKNGIIEDLSIIKNGSKQIVNSDSSKDIDIFSKTAEKKGSSHKYTVFTRSTECI